jgi:hypothetical protein
MDATENQEVPQVIIEEKPLGTMVMVKTASHDDSTFVVGMMASETTTSLLVEFPILVSSMYDENGQKQIYTAKYFPYAAGETVSFNKTGIVSVAAPSKPMLDMYLMFLKRYHESVASEHNDAIEDASASVSEEPVDLVAAPVVNEVQNRNQFARTNARGNLLH